MGWPPWFPVYSVHQYEFANVLPHVPPIEKGYVLSESEVGCKLILYHAALRKS